MNAIEDAHRVLQTKRDRHRADIGELATRNNLAIDPAKVRNPERVAANLQRAAELEEEIRRMEASG